MFSGSLVIGKEHEDRELFGMCRAYEYGPVRSLLLRSVAIPVLKMNYIIKFRPTCVYFCLYDVVFHAASQN